MTTTAAARTAGTLGPRLLTAVVGLPVLLAVIWLGGPVYTAVVAVALAAGFWEFVSAAKLGRIPLTIAGALTVAGVALAAHHSAVARDGALAAGIVATFLCMLATGRVPESLAPWAETLGGVAYVGLLGSYFVDLRHLPDGRDWVLLAVLTTFATDTGAYAVGRLLGRHKLAPTLSPAKTVEGAVGGLLAGALAAVALNAVLDLGASVVAMALLGLLAALAAEVGDLSESVLKRVLGVKDMGHIFPGHGGILDRLDSLLLVVPLVYAFVYWWLL